jgi:hypothetical protein
MRLEPLLASPFQMICPPLDRVSRIDRPCFQFFRRLNFMVRSRAVFFAVGSPKKTPWRTSSALDHSVERPPTGGNRSALM